MIEWGSTTLQARLLEIHTVTGRSKPFLLYRQPSGELRSLTYGETGDMIGKIGALFASKGLQPQDRVLIASRDDGHVAALVLACFYHGLSAVIADAEAPPPELKMLALVARPTAAVADEPLREVLSGACPAFVLPVVSSSGKKGKLFSKLLKQREPINPEHFPHILESFSPSAMPDAPPDEDEAYVLFSSGTTSRPKGVGISRRSLLVHANTLSRQWGYTEKSRILNVLPLNHTDGLVQGCITAWLNGAACLRTRRFSLSTVGDLLDDIYTHRATHFVAVPTILSIIDQVGEDYEDAFQTEDFRFIISAAGYLNEALWERFEKRFRVRIANIYGLTETVTGSLFCGPDDRTYKRGTVGKPVDCEVRIVDDACREVPPGEDGEIILRGEHVMTGYVHEPEETSKVLRDGWLHTGDIGKRDEEGFYLITGRKKNIIISGGLNIQPEEITETLLSFPGILEAAAFGIKDETFGEIACAAVVMKEGTPFPLHDIVHFCRERLSTYKVPRHIVPVPELPKGPSGKVILSKAKETFALYKSAAGKETAADVGEEVLKIAARIFHEPRPLLGVDSSPETTPGWDSFAHLTFILELETVFGIRLSTADIMSTKSLKDAVRIVNGRIGR